MKLQLPTKEDMLNTLYTVYDKSKDGIPYVSQPVDKMAEEYITRAPNKEKAAQNMLNMQIAKCTTSGFVTGFGGAITLPITIPANIGSVLYVQMRMIACAAYIGGLDLNSDQTQTFVFVCLAGVSVNEVVKKFGIKFGEKLAEQGIRRIPGKVLTKINQRVGFRLVTKFGEKGLINLGKMIPVVGAVINGGFDLVETKVIADRAYKMFILKDFNIDGEKLDDDVLDEENDKNAKNVRVLVTGLLSVSFSLAFLSVRSMLCRYNHLNLCIRKFVPCDLLLSLP